MPSEDVTAPLAAEWHRVLAPFQVGEGVATAAFLDLAARYSEASRHYHNLTHLAEVLTVIDGLVGWGDEAAAVRLAAWFHDAVYDPRAPDNEERSAELAATALDGFGLPQSVVAEVGRLVLLTKTHRAESNDRDEQVLLDADLAILGADVSRYDEYARAIRGEYGWVAEDAYRAGRGRVLEGFLQRPRIYLTDALLNSHEDRARQNLRRELVSLTAGRFSV